MTPDFAKTIQRLSAVILSLALAGCTLRGQPPSLTKTVTPTQESPTPVVSTQQIPMLPTYSFSTPLPAALSTLTPVAQLVTITAVHGNLYIRRGSGSDFNPIGLLEQGQTVTALGRDILGKWLYIPMMSTDGKFGWVSTLTIYSSVGGHIMDLPVVDSPLAYPAFIQNCSVHNVLVQPANVIIPPYLQFPNNVVQFNPGEYTIYDYDVVKTPEILTIELREGETFQLTASGTVAHHKCPEGQ